MQSIKHMKEGIYTVSRPSPIADDGVVRASVTLEVADGQVYTHNESVRKGLECLGLIFGWKDTNAESHREEALAAIASLAEVLRDDYGMDIRNEEEEMREITPPVEG